MRSTPAILREIIDFKRTEVAHAKKSATFAELEAMVAQEEPARNFFAAIRAASSAGETAVIAEVKRQSPSAGLIRPEYAGEAFKPEIIAGQYEAAGAAAISCLTDEHFFGGHLSFIRRIKDAVQLPVLRKDFLIDPWQLWQSRAAGADAVLLIAECLPEGLLLDMLILAQQLGLTTLVEVHEPDNLRRVLPHIGFPHPGYWLLGINNRDLSNMKVDLNHSIRLARLVEDRSIIVSESGITSPADLARLRAAGINTVLVGEHLMRQPDQTLALTALFGIPPKRLPPPFSI